MPQGLTECTHASSVFDGTGCVCHVCTGPKVSKYTVEGGGGGEGEGRGKHIELPRFMHHECGRESPPPPPTPVWGRGEKTNVKCCPDIGISSYH